jgi:hypothetical protein
MAWIVALTWLRGRWDAALFALSERRRTMRWTPTRVFVVVVVVVVIVVVATLQVSKMSGDIECPEDYWPHQAQTPGLDPAPPMPVPTVLRDMLDDAVAAYEGETDPIKKLLLGDCIALIWRCAWQDLPGHWGEGDDKETLRENHALLVEKAAKFAEEGNWERVKEYMTPNVVIPDEGIDHPH